MLLRSILVSSLAVALVAPAAQADALEFDFKDPKGVNAVSFLLDSELEPIRGIGWGVHGAVHYDPATPETISGALVVDADTIETTNKRMTQYLHGKDWLNVREFKEVTFKFKSAKDIKKQGDTVSMTATGDFTCRGVTREITVPVSATYLKGRLGERIQDKKGDLLVLRSTFVINRKDYGIKEEYGPQLVAEKIEIRAQIVGVKFDE